MTTRSQPPRHDKPIGYYLLRAYEQSVVDKWVSEGDTYANAIRRLARVTEDAEAYRTYHYHYD